MGLIPASNLTVVIVWSIPFLFSIALAIYCYKKTKPYSTSACIALAVGTLCYCIRDYSRSTLNPIIEIEALGASFIMTMYGALLFLIFGIKEYRNKK